MQKMANLQAWKIANAPQNVLFQPKFGSNMDKPKCWVKNAIKKNVQLKVI